MAIKHPFKVRETKHTDAVEFKIELPTSLDDKDLIKSRYGTVKRMIDRANAQLVVDVAPGIRKRLPNAESAQLYATDFCDNGSRDAYTAPTINAEDAAGQGFDEGQMAFLREKGMIA